MSVRHGAVPSVNRDCHEVLMSRINRKPSAVAVGLVLGVAIAMAIEPLEARGSQRPIEVGPSQTAHCKRLTPKDGISYRNCVTASHLLTAMNAEPRDTVWADKMESDLNDWLESLATEGLISRNIECRLSWCMVEVGSGDGRIADLSYLFKHNWKLLERLSMFAPDIDNPNAGDEVLIFKRFCTNVGELLDSSGHVLPGVDAAGKGC